MNWRGLVESVQRWYAAHGERDRRIILGVAIAVALAVLYVGVVEPVLAYRASVAEEMIEGQERLAQAERFVGALESLRAERNELRQKLAQARERLLPGDTGAIAAAALQDRVNAIAAERGITVQSTQVMREEEVAPFRKVSVRLTLSGELRAFAGLLADLEYGQHALRVPFMEISRRGAAVARAPRALSISLEVSGYQGSKAEPEPPAEAAPAEGEEAAPAEGGETAPREGGESATGESTAPPAEGPAPARLEAGAAPANEGTVVGPAPEPEIVGPQRPGEGAG